VGKRLEGGENALREFFFYFSACSHQAVPPSTAPCKAVIPLPIQSSARTLLISSNQLTLNICFIPPVDPTGVFILVLFFYFFFLFLFCLCWNLLSGAASSTRELLWPLLFVP